MNSIYKTLAKLCTTLAFVGLMTSCGDEAPQPTNQHLPETTMDGGTGGTGGGGTSTGSGNQGDDDDPIVQQTWPIVSVTQQTGF